MDDAFVVGGGQALGGLDRKLDRFARRHVQRADAGAQGFALEQFADHVMDAAGLPTSWTETILG